MNEEIIKTFFFNQGSAQNTGQQSVIMLCFLGHRALYFTNLEWFILIACQAT